MCRGNLNDIHVRTETKAAERHDEKSILHLDRAKPKGLSSTRRWCLWLDRIKSNMLTVQKIHTYIEMSEFALTKIPARYTTAVQADWTL